MKQVLKYESNDGRIWDSEAQALARDKVMADVVEAMAPLRDPATPDSLDFENGNGWVQHDPANVLKAKAQLIELCRPHLGEWMERQATPLLEIDPSWFGRMLDGGHPQLERAWSRLTRITPDGREFGQPFYAANPDKATGGCVADYRTQATD